MVRLARLPRRCGRARLVGLSWSDVDLERRTATLRETKNGTTRTVPLSSAAIAVLRQLASKRDGDGPVFELQVGRAVTHAFAKATEKAKIENLHFHDLRHEATSRLFERTDLRDIEIASITGHKTMEMLKRYAHLRASDLADRLGLSVRLTTNAGGSHAPPKSSSGRWADDLFEGTYALCLHDELRERVDARLEGGVFVSDNDNSPLAKLLRAFNLFAFVVFRNHHVDMASTPQRRFINAGGFAEGRCVCTGSRRVWLFVT